MKSEKISQTPDQVFHVVDDAGVTWSYDVSSLKWTARKDRLKSSSKSFETLKQRVCGWNLLSTGASSPSSSSRSTSRVEEDVEIHLFSLLPKADMGRSCSNLVSADKLPVGAVTMKVRWSGANNALERQRYRHIQPSKSDKDASSSYHSANVDSVLALDLETLEKNDSKWWTDFHAVRAKHAALRTAAASIASAWLAGKTPNVRYLQVECIRQKNETSPPVYLRTLKECDPPQKGACLGFQGNALPQDIPCPFEDSLDSDAGWIWENGEARKGSVRLSVQLSTGAHGTPYFCVERMPADGASPELIYRSFDYKPSLHIANASAQVFEASSPIHTLWQSVFDEQGDWTQKALREESWPALMNIQAAALVEKSHRGQIFFLQQRCSPLRAGIKAPPYPVWESVHSYSSSVWYSPGPEDEPALNAIKALRAQETALLENWSDSLVSKELKRQSDAGIQACYGRLADGQDLDSPEAVLAKGECLMKRYADRAAADAHVKEFVAACAQQAQATIQDMDALRNPPRRIHKP